MSTETNQDENKFNSSINIEHHLSKIKDTPSYFDVAKIFYEKYKRTIICACVTSKDFYQFSNHQWKKIDIDIIYKLLTSLNSSSRIHGVLYEWSILAHDKDFLNKLDKNTNLLCFTNGVYDFNIGSFRDGVPEDYTSINTKYDYEQTLVNLFEVNDFLAKIFPNMKIREYVIQNLSNNLTKTNGNLTILNSAYPSGKTTFLNLIRLIMGEYCERVTYGQLKCSKQSDGTRIGILEDHDNNMIFDFELSKECNFYMASNTDLFDIRNSNLIEHTKRIYFHSRFTNGSSDYTDTHKSDLNLNDKLINWRQTLMTILINNHKKQFDFTPDFLNSCKLNMRHIKISNVCAKCNKTGSILINNKQYCEKCLGDIIINYDKISNMFL